MTQQRTAKRSEVPTLEEFMVDDVGLRDWGREVLIAHTPQYLGKVLYMNAGAAGGLQHHTKKLETFYLFEGEAIVDYDDGDGHLVSTKMVPGQSFHVPIGAPHRVTATKPCILFEVSTPHFDDRVRDEERYGIEIDPENPGLPSTTP